MNAKTTENLIEIFELLAKARSKARSNFCFTDDSALHDRRDRQKYMAIAESIGDIQHFIVSRAIPVLAVCAMIGCSTKPPEDSTRAQHLPPRVHRQALEELHRIK